MQTHRQMTNAVLLCLMIKALASQNLKKCATLDFPQLALKHQGRNCKETMIGRLRVVTTRPLWSSHPIMADFQAGKNLQSSETQAANIVHTRFNLGANLKQGSRARPWSGKKLLIGLFLLGNGAGQTASNTNDPLQTGGQRLCFKSRDHCIGICMAGLSLDGFYIPKKKCFRKDIGLLHHQNNIGPIAPNRGWWGQAHNLHQKPIRSAIHLGGLIGIRGQFADPSADSANSRCQRLAALHRSTKLSKLNDHFESNQIIAKHHLQQQRSSNSFDHQEKYA